MRSIPREEFLWDRGERSLAYLDEPLALGDTGQTISAPHMVAIMLEELELESGLNVLEVGGGSGYNAALMACIVSGDKRIFQEKPVVTIERSSRLARFARENIARVGLSDYVEVVEGDGTLGYPQEKDEELYDRIIVTAGAPRVPTFLKSQLKSGGIIEVPVGGMISQTLVKMRKKGHGTKARFDQTDVIGCMFVPLVGSEGHH